ncbi:hypothetical protein [Paenibacillus sp. UMB4589-SE434]|uniref:hypothetical protein n=1 Tax=Paenibacillus sp. UMB4589-SE434 TaxID=3046314 RepID=UPI00254A2734|nr:hypothetical protein [Paenibacillus sp. UMB4589-SE434]MDK8182621.1 hypothetical protein [Paenibacillus sp. UMB4589-SE434]
MFDTVMLKVSPVYIEPEILNSHSPKSVTYYNKETRAVHTKYEIYDDKLPYIKYMEGSRTLFVQVSMPKLLYGDNVTLIDEVDIPLFFDCLQSRIMHLLDIEIPHSDWTVLRCDISWNFQVGNQVSEYVRMLSKQQMPFKNTTTYNQDQTVEYWNKSSRTMFYDKQKQTKKKEAIAVVERSKGILRLEVKSSVYDMKKHSSTRKAEELLSKKFFMYITGKVLEQIEYPDVVSDIDFTWLMNNRADIAKIETMLGFQMLQRMFDESTLRKLYASSTYANRKKTAKKMTIPTGNCLSVLAIND